MANFNALIFFYERIKKYAPDIGKEWLSAEYDEIYLPGPIPELISKEDNEFFKSIGITWNENADCWHIFT